ncbi:NrfD/PsrC family molybdoenzyme membrane anchor subunit [Rugosimonospora africana]|uniref:Polysulfide reductase n=1 Tax=Rugosimonospora africana TaxID=556532 RepID=A0A8J3QXF6_9ACTN|nr:NrfD/PsrC family molybdoenzyme membrane anchor subunit [Rugosimonospora africana]GIH16476.1 polysulfide reductase [Rugosimonospora africana]
MSRYPDGGGLPSPGPDQAGAHPDGGHPDRADRDRAHSDGGHSNGGHFDGAHSDGGRPERGARRRFTGGRPGTGLGDATVPAFASYYGQPILHAPNWAPVDIASYFFLGGLAGASSVLAAGAHAAGLPALARTSKVGAAVAIGGSLAALVHDLGRPGRFVNMLRVLKPTSPMSIGSWLLSGYAPVTVVAAASALTGRATRLGALATGTAGLLGPVVVEYTSVLIGDTAIPAWQDGHRELPFLFAGSAAAAAGGLGMLGAPVAQAGPARRTAAFGVLVDVCASKLMRQRLGMVAETYQRGRAGRLMRAARGLAVAGALGGLLLGRDNRAAAAMCGAALLAGSMCVRFAVFEAGLASARDPRYTVVPQRTRRAP